VTAVSDPAETYRKAEVRLRLLLLGDGTDTAGRVRGEEYRQQVTAGLRRMRNAFDAAVLENQESRAEKVEAPVGGLEDELQRIASFRSPTQRRRTDAIPAFVTPAEAAQALRVSVSSIYRAVRDGEIRAVRLTNNKRGALRIPASELEGFLDGTRHRAAVAATPHES
jgi:excisionase family DNA binding protein